MNVEDKYKCDNLVDPNGKNDAQPWLSDTGWECSEWAEEKLKSGWEVIEPPKDEKE